MGWGGGGWVERSGSRTTIIGDDDPDRGIMDTIIIVMMIPRRFGGLVGQAGR